MTGSATVDHPYPPGLIVAGMHRSGTSMVSSIFAATGWSPAGQLLGAAPSNPRGHFEDLRMLDLHNQLLASYHATWDGVDRLRKLHGHSLSLDPGEPRVSELVAAYRSGGPWMWKNPRSTLFIEDWARRFPEAQFVVCVRSPSAVVDSLWRRWNSIGIPTSKRFFRIRRTARMLALWRAYSLPAYRFACRHPDRAFVVRIPDDLPVLAAATDPPLFDPSLMRQRARLKIRVLCAFGLRSWLLYYRLRRHGDPKRLARLLEGPSPAGA